MLSPLEAVCYAAAGEFTRTEFTIRALVLLYLLAHYPVLAAADAPIVAVAANFATPMKVIADVFAEQSGESPRLSFGSSGKFYAQIRSGAPFDLFLSADQDKPARLLAEGLAVTGSRFTYAEGRLVLWSANPDLADVTDVLQRNQFRRLSLANPRLAPYGFAANEVLVHLGLAEATRDKRVIGENIAQAYMFVASHNADIGFVAASQVMQDDRILRGSGKLIPADWHSPIRQDAVLLVRGDNPASAAALHAFLGSPAAQRIMRQHGYR